MNSFKLYGTAIVLVMAGSIPAFAQETTEDTTEMVLPDRVLLAIEGTNTAYRVPLDVAVEACPEVVQADVFAALEEGADIVYCRVAETMVMEQDFANMPDVEFFDDLNEAGEAGDNDDDGAGDDGDNVGDTNDDEESGDNGEDGGTEGTGSDADGADDIDVNLDGTDDTEGSPDDDELTDSDGEGSDAGEDDAAGSDDGADGGADAGGDAGTDDGADVDAGTNG